MPRWGAVLSGRRLMTGVSFSDSLVSFSLGGIRQRLGHCCSGHAGSPVWHPAKGPIHPSPTYPPTGRVCLVVSPGEAHLCTNSSAGLDDPEWVIFPC